MYYSVKKLCSPVLLALFGAKLYVYLGAGAETIILVPQLSFLPLEHVLERCYSEFVKTM
jgi:hypothetical protein